VFTTLSAASASSLRPTSVEPVNDTVRTRGSCSIAETTAPDRRDARDHLAGRGVHDVEAVAGRRRNPGLSPIMPRG
jgi:hypothetical protein